MLTADVVVTRARSTLLDPNKRGWSDDELLSYLNGGMTQVVSLKPDAYPVVRDVSLDPGVLQHLPDDAVLFLDVLYNHAGDAVTVQPAHEFIRNTPGWAAADSGPTQYVLFDKRLPRWFHVSPPANSGMLLTMMFGAMAPRVAVLGDPIELPDWFETALWAFVVGTAYAKNSTRQNLAKSAQFIALFNQYVTGNTQAERLTAGAPDPAGEE